MVSTVSDWRPRAPRRCSSASGRQPAAGRDRAAAARSRPAGRRRRGGTRWPSRCRPVVETNSRTASPGATLTRSAKPSMACSGPGVWIVQSAFPVIGSVAAGASDGGPVAGAVVHPATNTSRTSAITTRTSEIVPTAFTLRCFGSEAPVCPAYEWVYSWPRRTRSALSVSARYRLRCLGELEPQQAARVQGSGVAQPTRVCAPRTHRRRGCWAPPTPAARRRGGRRGPRRDRRVGGQAGRR